MLLRIPRLGIAVWAIIFAMFYPLFNWYGWLLLIHLWPFFLIFNIFAFVRYKSLKINNKICMFSLLFLLYILVSYVFIGRYDGSLKILFYHSFEVITLIAFVGYSFRLEEINSVIKAYEIGGYLIVVKMILQHTVYGHEKFRYTIVNFGHQMDVNFLAATLVLPVLCVFARILSFKKKEKFNILKFLILIGGIVFTGSRGAILGLAVGMMVIYIDKKRLSLRHVLIIVGGLLTFVVVYNINPHVMQRFSISNLHDSSNDFRIRIWAAAWRVFKESPILGNGSNCIYTLAPRVGGVNGMSQHNMFLEVLTDYGLIGLFLFGGVIFLTIQLCLKNHNRLALAIMLSTVIMASLLPGLDSSFLWVNMMIVIVLAKNSKSVKSSLQVNY